MVHQLQFTITIKNVYSRHGESSFLIGELLFSSFCLILSFTVIYGFRSFISARFHRLFHRIGQAWDWHGDDRKQRYVHRPRADEEGGLDQICGKPKVPLRLRLRRVGHQRSRLQVFRQTASHQHLRWRNGHLLCLRTNGYTEDVLIHLSFSPSSSCMATCFAYGQTGTEGLFWLSLLFSLPPLALNPQRFTPFPPLTSTRGST